jgi:hypothetical protein
VSLSARGLSLSVVSSLVELWMLKPFLLLPRCWEEGGLVGGCRVVVDSSGTTLCVPAEDFQLAVAEQQNLF